MQAEDGDTMKAKTHLEFVSEIVDRPFEAVGEYAGALTKMQFRCAVDGHEWYAKPNHILGGSGCPVCSRVRSIESARGFNEVLEDHGDWLLLDISTNTYPTATMAVDVGVFEAHRQLLGGRMFAYTTPTSRYIYAGYHMGGYFISTHHNVLPKKEGLDTDHIVHGTMHYVDNRRSNLRRVTSSQNHMNHAVQNNNTSGVAGVSWDNSRHKWAAYIKIGYKKIHLGRFDNIDFAIGARHQAELEHFGRFAYNAV